MKRLIAAALFLVVSVGRVFASDVTYQGEFINGSFSSNTSYILDVPANNIDYLSMQAVTTSTDVYSATTFTDGRKAVGTITVSDIYVAGTTVTVNGQRYVEGIDWTKQDTTSGTALSLYNAISSSYTARATGSITVYSTYGVANSTLTVLGKKYVEGIAWNVGASSTTTAQNIYAALAADLVGTAKVSLSGTTINLTYAQYTAIGNQTISSTVDSSTITVSGMSGGRQQTLTRDVAFSPYYGATATGSLTVLTTYSLSLSSFVVYGTTFIENRDWYVQDTSTGTAQSIYSILASSFTGVLTAARTDNAVSLTYGIRTPTANVSMTSYVSSITVTGMSGGQYPIISATSTVVGAGGNYTLASSTSLIIASGMTGGASASVNYNDHSISGTARYNTGLPLLYAKSAGTDIGGLTSGVTYYAIPYTSTAFRIATSKTNATDGKFVNIVGTTTANQGLGTYTLTPILFTGSAGLIWQYSNDGTNYTAMSVSSVTATSVTADNTSAFWDFSMFNFRYLKASIVAPTWGAFKVIVTGIGKKVAP